jgi:uncharacterized membrane protein HdeD (DUF308 family)
MAIAVFVRDRDALRQRGWTAVLWGLALLLFGAAVLAWPAMTGRVFVVLVGALILAAGLVLVYGAWRLREVAPVMWIAALVPALAVAVFGGVVLAAPDAVSAVLLVIVAVLAILAGIGDLASALALSRIISWWWLRLLRGALLVGVGAWLIFSDLPGLVAVGAAVGVWALLLGGISITFGVLAVRR